MPRSKNSTAKIAESTLQDFRYFVVESESLLRRESNTQTSRFAEFILAAERIVLSELPQTIASIQPALVGLETWLIPHDLDILREARVTWNEDAYTNLLAWWLSPKIDSNSALHRQRAFLETIKLKEASHISHVIDPQVRLYTDDGIPDLVLKYPDFAVVIEAKTGTSEHETPHTGQPQTKSYHAAVRRLFDIHSDIPIHTAFLTIDGSPAANEDAYNVTFFEVALTISMQFRPVDFAPPLGSLIQAWLSHLLHEAGPPGLDIGPLISRFREYREEKETNPITLLPHLHTITLIHDATLRLSHE